jgi:molybdenum cofactor cytidylyltransferase
MGHPVTHCGIIILAAGESKRMGTPKQLLTYKGASLIARVAETAVSTALQPVVVVLGANADSIKTELSAAGLSIVLNDEWEEGMASSLRAGLNFITENNPLVDGVIILVADQPHLTSMHLLQLLETLHKTGLPAAACTYQGKLGTPALFHKSCFPQLLALTGDTGARKILTDMNDMVAKLPFEKGIMDIDTKEDYIRLLNENNAAS